MSKKKELPLNAYGGVEGSKYIPFISDRSGLKEITLTTVIIGCLLAIVFGASNTYSGLLSGLTVAAGIPGTIIGAGTLGIFAKKSGILNTNIVQGMASGGESVASGMIFVLPAVFIIGQDVTFIQGVLAGVAGAIIGIAISSIVHNYLIVEEHGTLVYPESMAISETLVTTSEGGEGLKVMGLGFGISGIVTALSYQVFNIVNSTFAISGEKIKWSFQMESNPLLLGIGFIVGMEVALSMFAGSILAYFVVIPAIGAFTQLADPSAVAWDNNTLLISEMTAAQIRGSYVKYIGAGMMLAGGFIGAIKLIPTIKNSLVATYQGMKSAEGGNAADSKNSMMLTIIGLVLVIGVSAMFSGSVAMAAVAGLLAVFFIIIFSIVAGKMTGDIGTSNLPVSGMTIASILIITLVFLSFGWVDAAANTTILLVTTIIVVAIAVSAGYTQSQKATYIIGGSKGAMQKSFVIATLVGVIVVTGVIIVLKEGILAGEFEAPQANLMATLTQGVLTGELPWTMIFTGIFAALSLYFLKLPIMTIAIGFYLPISTTSIILVGALVRSFVEKYYAKDEKVKDEKVAKGVILSSGLVAGGSIIGLIGVIFGIAGVSLAMDLNIPFLASNSAAIILLLLIVIPVLMVIMSGTKKDGK